MESNVRKDLHFDVNRKLKNLGTLIPTDSNSGDHFEFHRL